MRPLLTIVLFLILPTLFVWRLYRAPLRGDMQLQLMWRGAIAGLAGGIIGAALASLIFGLDGYWLLGYSYWLMVTAVLGMVFTFVIGFIQRSKLSFDFFGRVAVGALIGISTAALWASAIRMGFGGPMNWFSKGSICMIVGSGIVSGILGGPVRIEGRN